MSFRKYVQCASFFFWASTFLAFCLIFLSWALLEAPTFLYLPWYFDFHSNMSMGVKTSSLGQTVPLSMFCPMILVLPKLPNKSLNVVWHSHCATQHSSTNSDYQTWLQLNRSQKSNKRSMAKSITWETKREGQRKTKRCTTHRNQKKGRKLVLHVVQDDYINNNYKLKSGRWRTNRLQAHKIPPVHSVVLSNHVLWLTGYVS